MKGNKLVGKMSGDSLKASKVVKSAPSTKNPTKLKKK